MLCRAKTIICLCLGYFSDRYGGLQTKKETEFQPANCASPYISYSWRLLPPPTGVLQDSNGLRMSRRGRKILTHWKNTPKSPPGQSMGGRSVDGVEPIRNLSLSDTQPHYKQRSPDTEWQFTGTISLRLQRDAENVLFSTPPICHTIHEG